MRIAARLRLVITLIVFTPLTAAAQPDLSGIWRVMNSAAFDLQEHHAQPGVPAGASVVVGGDIPYQPWALKQRDENFAARATADPESQCYLPGVPRATYQGLPFEIVQTYDQLVFLYEYAHAVRYVYTNGTPHPRGPINWWMGDSRGRWEGDTLVVDVVHFTDQTWLDKAGNFHSDELHVVERYTPLGPDHIQYEATLEDPKVFTRPWTIRMILYRQKEQFARVLEYECYGFEHEEHYPYPGATLTLAPLRPAPIDPGARPAAEWTGARTADGQPDVQGFWSTVVQGTYDVTDPRTGGGRLDEILRERSGAGRVRRPNRVVDPADGRIPMQPWAEEKFREITAHIDNPTHQTHIDTQVRCLPTGVPRPLWFGQFRIVQTPRRVLILNEGYHLFRSIALDGRPPLGPRARLWMGDSRGRWEGNTLVVESTNFNGKPRIDMVGHFASDALQTTERWTFVDADTIEYRVTLDDPTVFTRPWTMAAQIKRRVQPGYEFWEDGCHEGERSADEMIKRAGSN